MSETELSAYERGCADTEELYRKVIARKVARALAGALYTDGRDKRDERRRIMEMILDGNDDGTIEGACERFMWQEVNGYAFAMLVRNLVALV